MRVRLRAEFLRSTGQYTGEEPFKRWTIQACACGLCSREQIVAVDDPHICQIDPRGYEDIPEDKRPVFRHVNVANLEPCK